MTKRQKRGWLLVLAGLCMVISALLMHKTLERQDAMAGENSAILLQQLQLSKSCLPDQEAPPPEKTMFFKTETVPEKEYLGYSMIGTIRVADLGIELPVLRDWSYELLEVAPCRYSGSMPAENLIILGHNYKSHFTPLHRISEGTAVEFEDVNGVIHNFTVDQTEILYKRHLDRLESEHPLILVTCTSGGQNRLVVRCSAAEPE